jgi:two-component system KDP operon response regulator KdpE
MNLDVQSWSNALPGLEVEQGSSSCMQYQLLTHLASHPDHAGTHQHLLKPVWGSGHAHDRHYVRVLMANLRK